MVTLVKHEWHQVDSQFEIELDESLLSEIYPDLDEDEITEKLAQIESGEVSVEEIVEAAYDNNVDLEWDRTYDDWWTDRKGGYEVTYELGEVFEYEDNPERTLELNEALEELKAEFDRLLVEEEDKPTKD